MLGGSDDRQAARWTRRGVQEMEGVVLRMHSAWWHLQGRIAQEEGGGRLEELQALLASPLGTTVGEPYLLGTK